MTLSSTLVDRIQAKSGVNVMTASDQELTLFLEQIQATTGHTIGLTTFKRMIGKISDHDHQPRQSTLNTFARYMGMDDWETLMLSVQQSDSSFETVEGEVRACDLPVGSTVDLNYYPDRELQFIKVSADEFEVSRSVNSKLQAGDRCRVTAFVLRFPLIIADVIRDGHSLGSYSAARSGGIRELSVHPA